MINLRCIFSPEINTMRSTLCLPTACCLATHSHRYDPSKMTMFWLHQEVILDNLQLHNRYFNPCWLSLVFPCIERSDENIIESVFLTKHHIMLSLADTLALQYTSRVGFHFHTNPVTMMKRIVPMSSPVTHDSG